MAKYKLIIDFGAQCAGDVVDSGHTNYVYVKPHDKETCSLMPTQAIRPECFPQVFRKIETRTKITYVHVKTMPEGTTVHQKYFIEVSQSGGLLSIEPPFTAHGGPVRLFERREEQVEE